MNRQNRAIPILIVLTIAFGLYLAGCFGSEETTTANESEAKPTPEPTATVIAVVTAEALQAESVSQFWHTVVEGDRLEDIAPKYTTTVEQILIANPGIDPRGLFIGDKILIPGATTDNSAADKDPTERGPDEYIDYAIRENDNFGTIAKEYTVSVQALEEANPGVDPRYLQINSLIVIPPYGTGLSASQLEALATTVPVQRDPGEPLWHVVAAGDNLSAIADVYDVTTDQIMEANALSNADDINVGTSLLIPPPLANPDGN